jgi:hypothetical protein
MVDTASKGHMVQWLKWRGLVPSNIDKQSKCTLMLYVRNVLRLQKKGFDFTVVEPSKRYLDEYTPIRVLGPIDGKVQWQSADHALDFICSKMADMHFSNFVVQAFEDNLQNNILNKARTLFDSGHILPSTLMITEQQDTVTKEIFKVLKVDVLATMKDDTYSLNLCCGVNGKLRTPPYSSCSCVTGEAICSHQVAGMFFIAHIQACFYTLNGKGSGISQTSYIIVPRYGKVPTIAELKMPPSAVAIQNTPILSDFVDLKKKKSLVQQERKRLRTEESHETEEETFLRLNKQLQDEYLLPPSRWPETLKSEKEEFLRRLHSQLMDTAKHRDKFRNSPLFMYLNYMNNKC